MQFMPFRSSRSAATPAGHQRKNIIVVGSSVFVIMIMGTLTYYSVPLYRMFCQATGFAGTTQVARSAPGTVAGPEITVRFDANVASNLPWRFIAPPPVKVHLGEQRQVSFTAVNLSHEPLLGTAIYNITPLEFGQYFYKIQCFCFTEQLLMPDKSKEFPVVFYVDPGIANDPAGRNVNTITLSYTFYNKGRDALEKYLQTQRSTALNLSSHRQSQNQQ